MARPALPAAWKERYVGAQMARAIGRIEPNNDNRGQIIDYVQTRNGGALGEFWCMDSACATGLDCFRRAWPLPKNGSCQDQRDFARTKGALRTRAEFDAAFQADPLSVAGWLFLSIDPVKDHAHHTGTIGIIDDDGVLIVRGPNGGWLTVEGNAANPKEPASRNGDGWYYGRERGTRGTVTDTGLYEFIDPAGYAA